MIEAALTFAIGCYAVALLLISGGSRAGRTRRTGSSRSTRWSST
jgi:hypothetical protein